MRRVLQHFGALAGTAVALILSAPADPTDGALASHHRSAAESERAFATPQPTMRARRQSRRPPMRNTGPTTRVETNRPCAPSWLRGARSARSVEQPVAGHRAERGALPAATVPSAAAPL